MIILDTNVLSALTRQKPETEVIRWLDRQPRTSIWTTAVTVFEIRFGLQAIAAGKRQRTLTAAFEHMLTELLERRIASFDSAAAEAAADLMAAQQKKGLPGELRDTMIAGIALATHATLATRNVKQFEDLACPVVNPWEA
jgi:predicted nucleic acid-binding protein